MCKGGGRHRQHPLSAPLSLNHTPQFSRVPGSTTAFRDGGHGQRASRIRHDTWVYPWRTWRATRDACSPTYPSFEQETRRAAAAPGDWNRGFASLARNLRPRQRLSAAHAQGRELQHRRSVSSNTDNQRRASQLSSAQAPASAREAPAANHAPSCSRDRHARQTRHGLRLLLSWVSTVNTSSRHFVPAGPGSRPSGQAPEREVEGERCTTKAFSSGRRRAAGPTLPAQM